ncbi:hypothetical protein EV122DRAFT_292907 [Schizophyllum commune]
MIKMNSGETALVNMLIAPSRTLSHCDASHAANANASDSSPATLEDELILEEQRRAALKRLLTQPDYPSRKNLAIYGPDNARLGSSTSMGPAAIHNSQQPIDRLPNEILGAIFLVCGDPSPASAFPRDGTMHQLPMDPHQVVPYSRAAVLLGRVCLRWYSITRGFPMLWTHVDVAYPGKEALSVLKLCLRYSAGLPLTLWISDRMKSTARQYSIHPRFTSLVAENAHRWREISIELYDELDVLDPLVALPLGAFTSLRRARLNFADLGALEDDLDTLLWRQFFSSPRLDCVDLVSMEYIRAGMDVAPLRQLTSLGLHFAEPAIVSTLLAVCTDLELLYIRIERSRFDREENQRLSLPSTYHLPRLRILILCGPIDWDPLFSSLTAPALDRLDMNRISIPHRAIEGMLARSMLVRLKDRTENYAKEFLRITSSHLLCYPLKTSNYALQREHKCGERMISNVMRQDAVGGMTHASPPLSPHDISPTARDAPADVGSTSSATGDLELALEERRREALKRVLTQPKYPIQNAGSKSAKALIHSDSNSMTRRQAHNSQLPINRLPNEILCAIFFVCGDPSPASAFPRDPTMHDAHINPLNLKSYSRNVVLFGIVCSRWYHVTHGFPALWTIVDVEYPARYATNILKRCLAHSAGLPLTLWISESVNPRFYTDDEDPDPRFMILVAANAHRWKEMSIELYDKSDVLAPLIALPPGAFGNLYRARVSFFRRGADATSPDTRLWKSWLTSPKLNTVDWVKIEHIRSGLAVAPLRQLTSIGLHVAEPAMLASVLNSCVNLELLHVDINPYRLGMKNIPPLTLASPICLPHLRTMIICGPNDWAPLFKALTVPALCRLELSRQEIHSHDIMDMLHRSRARLRMFTVHWPKVIQADQMLALLHSEPMRNIQVVRYDRYPPGGARRGWEDAFDLQPFVPSHVRYTTDYDEAENFYEGLEDT